MHGAIFPDMTAADFPQNELVIRLQPDPAVWLNLLVKKPGMYQKQLCGTALDLTMSDRWRDREIDAYERLFLEAIKGNSELFVRADELIESWRVWDRALHYIEVTKPAVEIYPFGSRGPAKADELLGGPQGGQTYEWHGSTAQKEQEQRAKAAALNSPRAAAAKMTLPVALDNPDIPTAHADVGIIGLATMGSNLVLNILDRGFNVATYNRYIIMLWHMMRCARRRRFGPPLTREYGRTDASSRTRTAPK